MSMESSLQTLLTSRCARVWEAVAPGAQATPYVVWQAIGGASLVFTENTFADKRNTLMQIAAWGADGATVRTLIRNIEADLLASTAFIATPEGEPISTYEEDTKLFGVIQRFSIYSART